MKYCSCIPGRAVIRRFAMAAPASVEANFCLIGRGTLCHVCGGMKHVRCEDPSKDTTPDVKAPNCRSGETPESLSPYKG